MVFSMFGDICAFRCYIFYSRCPFFRTLDILSFSSCFTNLRFWEMWQCVKSMTSNKKDSNKTIQMVICHAYIHFFSTHFSLFYHPNFICFDWHWICFIESTDLRLPIGVWYGYSEKERESEWEGEKEAYLVRFRIYRIVMECVSVWNWQ